MKARIKRGAKVFQDFRVGVWPESFYDYDMRPDPDTIFECTPDASGQRFELVAHGFGKKTTGGYGNGSIISENKDDLVLMYDNGNAIPFKLEERYIVFKIKHFTSEEVELLKHIAKKQKPFECVVVESDWEAYQPTVDMIERQYLGQPVEPVQPSGLNEMLEYLKVKLNTQETIIEELRTFIRSIEK